MTHALGSFAGDGDPLALAGCLALLGVTGLLERVQWRLKADEGRAWWASNGRDLLNAFALGAVSVALWLRGFRGPLAVCVGGTIVLVLSVWQDWLQTRARSTLASVLAALVLALPAVLAPATVAAAFLRAVTALVP